MVMCKDFFKNNGFFSLSVWCDIKGGLTVRISFSNMLKEFKSTPTWLQFPFLCAAAKVSVDESTAKTNRHGKIPAHMQIVIHSQLWPGDSRVHFWIEGFMITYYTVPGFMGPAPPSVRWTCLMLDLEYMLSIYLKHCYHSLKSIKLCANMAVKNMFTSDLLLEPGETVTDHL